MLAFVVCGFTPCSRRGGEAEQYDQDDEQQLMSAATTLSHAGTRRRGGWFGCALHMTSLLAVTIEHQPISTEVTARA